MANKADWVLEHGITGYHQYVLSAPIHLEFASQNLCDILGANKAELESCDKDLYINWVHPEDRESYISFIDSLVENKAINTIQYRLITSNKTVVYVSDTITVMKNSDGILIGISVLTDISTIRKGIKASQFLNDNIPCGFIKFTCEKQPKITYINKYMIEMLGFASSLDKDDDILEMYCSNLFMMIHPDDRRRFSHYLNRVYTYGSPLAGEINILKKDGTRGVFFGLVTKCINEFGKEEFQSVCIDISERYEQRKSSEISRYLKILADVYDIIFEYDLENKTVKCLYAPNSDSFMNLINMPMQMKECTEGWIKETVFEDDKEIFSKYFHDFFNRKQDDDSDFSQITYRAFTKKGLLNTYVGQFIKISNSISLFCCRKVRESEDNVALKSEIISLENMQEMVMSFYDGIAGFEIMDDYIKPLYMSDNVRKLFGYTKDKWLAIMKHPIPLKDFIVHSKISYNQVVKLFKTGQGEFTYHDFMAKKDKVVKAICSQRTTDKSIKRYVMLYNSAEKTPNQSKSVSIRTFGYFDVFVFGKPIAFRSEKAKELLALLVDRKGGFVSSEEAIGYLWPDETANTVTMSRYRKVALRLKNILIEYGVLDIIESVDGKRRIVPENVQCDLYDYLSGKKEFAQNFKGNYLTNYSWGEFTLGELLAGNTIY